MKRHYYSVQAYDEGDPGYLACYRVHSRRRASNVYGRCLSLFPGAIVTLNRREFDGKQWVTTTHHDSQCHARSIGAEMFK